MSDVRVSIRGAWENYARGDLSLLAVGKITNTGFGIMRNANEEIVKSYPEFSNYLHVPRHLKVSVMAEVGLAAIFPLNLRGSERPSSAIRNPAELSLHERCNCHPLDTLEVSGVISGSSGQMAYFDPTNLVAWPMRQTPQRLSVS